MFRTSFAAAASIAALASVATAGAAPAEQATPGAASFSDAAGDSGAAPDVTDVGVGNDVVAGGLVFWVTLENRPEDLAGEDVLWIAFDVDRNAATGDEFGAEHWIGVDAESVWLERWDGTDYVEVDAPSLRASFVKSLKTVRVSVHPDQLGASATFDFFVSAVNGDVDDAAPNGPPAWSYTLTTGRPPLVVLGSAVRPKRPAAGKTVTAGIFVGRGDTLDVLAEGKVTCALVVGGKRLKATRSGLAEGVAFCQWKLPKTAQGKTFKATVTASFGGSTAKKSFSGRVR